MDNEQTRANFQALIGKRFPNMEACTHSCISNPLNTLSQDESRCFRRCVMPSYQLVQSQWLSFLLQFIQFLHIHTFLPLRAKIFCRADEYFQKESSLFFHRKIAQWGHAPVYHPPLIGLAQYRGFGEWNTFRGLIFGHKMQRYYAYKPTRGCPIASWIKYNYLSSS